MPFILLNFNNFYFVCSSAYPDGHPDKETDEDGELEFLKQKVDAGADFIMTQLFYDVDNFLRWERKVRSKGPFWVLH